MTAAKTTSRKAIDPRAEPAAQKAESAPPQKDTVTRRPTSADKAKARGAELVSVTVPVPFKHTAPGHHLIDYPSGIYDMPRAHAEDSFSCAMGVTLND